MVTVLHEKCDRADQRHRIHWIDIPPAGVDPSPARCLGTPLPYGECTAELHEQYRGACYFCCPTCDHNAHQCPGCGEELRHDHTEWTDDHPPHADCWT